MFDNNKLLMKIRLKIFFLSQVCFWSFDYYFLNQNQIVTDYPYFFWIQFFFFLFDALEKYLV